MATYQEERERFVEAWVRNGGRYPAASLVMKHAKAIERRAVDDCNGVSMSQRNWNAFARAVTVIENACKECGFSVRFGGDPRGYTTKIAFPDGAFNSWGGKEEGWGVPTR